MSDVEKTRTFSPIHLGMEKAIELIAARQETFFYRKKHKRVIDHRVLNAHRWSRIKGPLIYVVTDREEVVRYVGKWISPTPLFSRWIRHKTIHHQESTRTYYLENLDAGRGPLAVWSISVAELKTRLPQEFQGMPEANIAVGLEALWIRRWKEQLVWNGRYEPELPGFHDGNLFA